MLGPHFLSCFWDEIAVIDRIRQITTERRRGVEGDVLYTLQVAHVSCLKVGNSSQSVNLEISCVICTVERARHVIVPVESIERAHDIVHKNQLSS